MKIRWTHNSIRFRITPSELGALENGAPIETSFSLLQENIWTARIEPDNSQTRLEYISGVLRLQLCAADLEKLRAQDAEGVYFSDGDLRYFIEKDFPCAHPRAGEAAEPETKTFYAPQGFEERKNA